MYFEQLSTDRGCQSYILGCNETQTAVIVDPEISLIEQYQASISKTGYRVNYIFDTHTHADHFSATRQTAQQFGAPVVMHKDTGSPFASVHVDNGDRIDVGNLHIDILHTPGHTQDSICLVLEDRVLTGDTLLISGVGRTDLPTGNSDKLYDSLFNGLFSLDLSMKVYPGHDYKRIGHSSLEHELANNPRLQRSDRSLFIAQMDALDLNPPQHLTEALRVNLHGGESLDGMILSARKQVPAISSEKLKSLISTKPTELYIVDIRDSARFRDQHIPNAISISRATLELDVNQSLTDPTKTIVTYCEDGKISTLAAATLMRMGFKHSMTLEKGIIQWLEHGFDTESDFKNPNSVRK